MGAPALGDKATPAVSRAEWGVLVSGLLVTTVAVVATRMVASEPAAVFWDNVHWTAAYASAAVVAFLASRRASGTIQRSRRWFALGLASLLVGQLCWDVQVAVGWNPFPGPSDAFFVALGPLLGGGVLSLATDQSRARRAAILLDGLGFGLAVLALTLAAYLPHRGDFDTFTLAVLTAYPTGLLTVTALLVIVLLELREPLRASTALLVMGILGHGLLWMQWNSLTLENGLGSAQVINYLFSYDTLLFGAAVATFEPSARQVEGSSARLYDLASRILPLGFVVAAAAAVGLSSGLLPAVRVAVTVCMGGVILVAVIRQSLLLEERDRLLAAEAENRVLQQRLAASQRLESLGTLASGIAHDFNNVLTAILGNVELLAHDAHLGPDGTESIDAIRSASLRARDLVRRILAFSRREASRREPVDCKELSREVMGLLRAALPARHTLRVEARRDASAMANAAQLHQVLMNLGTNASHAIGEKAGTITFGVDERLVSEGDRGLPPGRYAVLSVRDDGAGMDPETQARAFEPFFTTKPRGEGTGLGLSVVHGIVTEHGGAVEVESAAGRGTTLRVVIPAPAGEQNAAPGASPRVVVSSPPSSEEILVVDDEAMIAGVLVRVCARLGHAAVAVRVPEEALRMVRDEPARFALVVTDMSMPTMSGIELARALREVRADLPIVLSSGTDFVVTGTPFDGVLPKPYGGEAVAQVLETHVRRHVASPLTPGGRITA